MSSYTDGWEDGVRATKAEYLKRLEQENLHPVKELTDEEIEKCTNSDSWNCKYCKKTETCKALKDPRNFGTPKYPMKQISDEEILVIADKIYNKSIGDDIEFARAILRKAQE